MSDVNILLDYCHQNSIAHRDLKIENMLVDLNGNIKILDFGLSNFYKEDETLKTFCGSLYFAAPELLMGRAYVGPEVDVWALGVVLYVMVCGKVPFDDKSLSALHEKIKRCDISYPSHLSEDCKNLLQSMINPDPKKRASITDVVNHPWLNLGFNFTVRNFFNERVPLDSIDPLILDFLTKEFRAHYTYQQIKAVLEAALEDWAEFKTHPIISLYYLTREKLIREGVLVPIPTRPLGTRSPSCPELVPPPEIMRKADISEARKTRNLAVSVSTALRPSSAEANAQQPRGRSKSVSSQAGSFTPSYVEGFEVKTVYLKGLFSINSSSKKNPKQLRSDIIRVLSNDGIVFDNLGAVFQCEYFPSIGEGDEEKLAPDGQGSKITFEIHIVRVAVLGQFGVLFKRIHGDISLYKNLCTQILTQLDL